MPNSIECLLIVYKYCIHWWVTFVVKVYRFFKSKYYGDRTVFFDKTKLKWVWYNCFDCFKDSWIRLSTIFLDCLFQCLCSECFFFRFLISESNLLTALSNFCFIDCRPSGSISLTSNKRLIIFYLKVFNYFRNNIFIVICSRLKLILSFLNLTYRYLIEYFGSKRARKSQRAYILLIALSSDAI